MFKKTLLALALTSVAGVANAGTLTVERTADQGKISIQGVAVSATPGKLQAAKLGDIALEAGTDYVVNDILVVTLSGAKFDKSVTPTAVSDAEKASRATFSFVDFADDNTARFRVTANDHIAIKTPADGDKAAVYNKITLDDFQLLTGSPVNNQKVEFSSNAISVNPLIGGYDASKATEVAKFVDQFTYKITKLDGVVATGKGRAEFVKVTSGTSTSTGLDDVLTLAYTDAGGVAKIIPTKQSHVIKGNFSFFADYDLVANGGNGNGKVDTAELANAVKTDGFTEAKLSVNDTLSVLTLTDANAPKTASTVSTVTFNVIGQKKNGSVISTPNNFTIDSTVASATNAVALNTASAGSWSLDGSSDDIELMPFGAEYAQSITVANRGSVAGAITVTLKADGKTYSKELSQVAAANSVTNISLAVAAFAAESGVTGNAHVNVIVNAPDGNIGVKGVYYHKASADRVLTY